jgi:archaellum component FlaG (FlaF/FlaG flagellin family)
VTRSLRLFLAALAIAAATACSDGPLELANLQVGRSLNQDRSVSSITTLFKPHETVYVSVQTKAGGKGTIAVKWMFGTQVVDEPSKSVSYDGPSSTEFHLQNNGGFPVGDYSVEVFIDGKSVGTRAFKVAAR